MPSELAPCAGALSVAGAGPAEQRQALGTLRAMVEITSVTGDEARLASYLAGRMTELGYRARIDAAGNVTGEIGDPAGPAIMLLGHIDTVPGVVPVRREGDLLYGRGSVDAKGPMAAMIHAGALSATRAAARVVVVGAVGEEGDSAGARHLLKSPRPDALIVGEPSGARQVVVGYKGLLRLRYRISRPAQHTSGPVPGAVQAAAAVWAAIGQRLADQYKEDGPAFDRAVAALVGLHGNTEGATADVSVRVPAGFDSAGFAGWLRGKLSDGTLDVTEDVPAVRTGRADPVVRALCAAIREHGAEATIKVKLGTSDLNVVQPHWDVPAAVYGPGDSHLDHSADEHLDLREYLLAIDVLSSALPSIAEVAARHKEGGEGR